MKILRTTLITSLGAILLVATAHAEHGRYQTANVLDATAANQGYVGAAWLNRTRSGISGRIMAQVSTAGDPYTLWIVVFNNPSACGDDGCNGMDLGNAAVGGSVFNGTGAISASDGMMGEGGVVNMDFSIPAHPLPNGLFLLAGDPDGLYKKNGYAAEIHLVIDKHPSIPPGDSWIDDLTTTNIPGMGPATNDSFAVFLGCSDDDSDSDSDSDSDRNKHAADSCPPSVL